MPCHLFSLLGILILSFAIQPTLAWPFLHAVLPYLQRLVGRDNVTVSIPTDQQMQMMSNNDTRAGWERHCPWCSADTILIPEPPENYTTHCQLVVTRPIDSSYPLYEFIEVTVLSHDFKQLRGMVMPVPWDKETDIAIGLVAPYTPTIGKITVRSGRSMRGRKRDLIAGGLHEGEALKPALPSSVVHDLDTKPNSDGSPTVTGFCIASEDTLYDKTSAISDIPRDSAGDSATLIHSPTSTGPRHRDDTPPQKRAPWRDDIPPPLSLHTDPPQHPALSPPSTPTSLPPPSFLNPPPHIPIATKVSATTTTSTTGGERVASLTSTSESSTPPAASTTSTNSIAFYMSTNVPTSIGASTLITTFPFPSHSTLHSTGTETERVITSVITSIRTTTVDTNSGPTAHSSALTTTNTGHDDEDVCNDDETETENTADVLSNTVTRWATAYNTVYVTTVSTNITTVTTVSTNLTTLTTVSTELATVTDVYTKVATVTITVQPTITTTTTTTTHPTTSTTQHTTTTSQRTTAVTHPTTITTPPPTPPAPQPVTTDQTAGTWTYWHVGGQGPGGAQDGLEADKLVIPQYTPDGTGVPAADGKQGPLTSILSDLNEKPALSARGNTRRCTRKAKGNSPTTVVSTVTSISTVTVPESARGHHKHHKARETVTITTVSTATVTQDDNHHHHHRHHYHHHHHHHDHHDGHATPPAAGPSTVTAPTTIFITNFTTVTPSSTSTSLPLINTQSPDDGSGTGTGTPSDGGDMGRLQDGLEPPMFNYSVTRPDGGRHISLVMYPDDPAWRGPFGNVTEDQRFVVYYALFQCMG